MNDLPELRLTNSEMKLWRRCKRQWYLAYYLRWGKRTPDFNKPTGIGTRVHTALEIIYDPARQHIDPLESMAADIQSDIEEFPELAEDIAKEGELAATMIEGYLQWLGETGADQGLELISAEEGVEVALPETPGVTLLSKIDSRLRKEADSSRWAMDHKTVPSLKMPLPQLQIDTQLLTEHLAEFLKLIEERGIESAKQETADGVFYNMLRKVKRTVQAKPPFYGREEVRHNITELRNHWRHVKAIAEEILAVKAALDGGADHQTACYPNPTRDCSWDCPFFEVCPMMDDGSDWEGLLADRYEQVNPLERYAKREWEAVENDDDQ